MNKKKVLLGMSGGVDSSVAAILLKEQGYDVCGVTMKLWEDENEEIEGGCCSISSTFDAKRVCDILGISHYVLNFKKEFQEYVINDFICKYSNCMTPNPCIECNKYLKFYGMYKKAKELGMDYISTGHYAKTEYSHKYKRYALKKSDSINKDQTYALYNIPKDIIGKVLFPLGEFKTKDQVRKKASEYGLNVASKPDSQEICFIPDNNYICFLEKKGDLRAVGGEIVNTKGEILGRHNGLHRYTIGQRRGMGISSNKKLYVVDMDKENNRLIIGDEKQLYSKELYVDDVNLILVDEITCPTKVNVKIRYGTKEIPGTIYPIEKGKIRVVLDEGARAATKGQAAVFYLDKYVLGRRQNMCKGTGFLSYKRTLILEHIGKLENYKRIYNIVYRKVVAGQYNKHKP